MSSPRPSTHLNPALWLQGLLGAIFKPRPVRRLWKWIDQYVRIPESSGGPSPGQMRTARFPIFRGLYDLTQQRGVHFLTLCSSARAGKTLFCICLVLYWISERFGAIVWLDPTRKSATKLVRSEMEDFLLECGPVRALAIVTKTLWTTLEKAFRGKRFRIVGSGAEADLHGFNAELAIENELDACRHSTEADAASADKIEARTKLFASSRLIVRNSTPQKGEFGPTWTKFKLGTQHHCYVPCPHCSADRERALSQAAPFVEPAECKPGWSAKSYDPRLAGWQRFTFFSEKAAVPFDAELQSLRDANGNLLPRSQWREEVTGQANFERYAIMEERPRLDDPTQLEKVRVGWNLKGVRRGTTYQCAHCARQIEQVDHSWMLARYRWMAHNPELEVRDEDAGEEDTREDTEPEEHISAHVWSWYSPFEQWGTIAAAFLQAKGNLGQLITFWVYTLGRPFVREGTAIKESDLDRVVGRCPVRYQKGQLPFKPELLAMAIDRQGTERFYGIRAFGVHWDLPDRPTWSALIDWGEIASDQQILEVAGHVEDPSGHRRRFVWRDPKTGEETEFAVSTGLYDCGFEQQAVWNFCLTQPWLSPSKGGGPEKTGGNPIRLTDVMDDQLKLVWFWSDLFTSELYYSCIREGRSFAETIHWYLPCDIDAMYRTQLTDEYQKDEAGKRVWDTRTKMNHLGDVEKNLRVLAGKIEEFLDTLRERRAAEEKKDEVPRADAETIRERVRALSNAHLTGETAAVDA